MDALPNRPDWHRYMVVMAAADGFSLSEVSVPLYPRNAGQSKFGIGRIPVGVLDMLAVWFELRFARKPLLLFGLLGAVLFVIGVIVGIVAILWRVIGGVGIGPLMDFFETCVSDGALPFASGCPRPIVTARRGSLPHMTGRYRDWLCVT